MSEIGIIGATYEDRRTKKKGKLVERDEKFKTLLMESSDGKSFNITFGGFKSNWRKIDEPEQTLEEAMEEIPIPEQEKKQKPKKEKPKKKLEETDEVNIGLESLVKSLVVYLDSFNSNILNINPHIDRNLITIKLDNRKFLEFIKGKKIQHSLIACKEDVAVEVKNYKCVKNLKYYPTRKPLNYAFVVDDNKLEEFFNQFRSFVVKKLSDIVEEGE